MKYLVCCLLVILQTTCGSEEVLGPVGTFTIDASIEMNNCIGVSQTLPREHIVIEEDSEIRTIGSHKIIDNRRIDPEGCIHSLEKSIDTTQDKYIGIYLYRISCSETRNCLAVYIGEFKKERDR